MYRVGAESLWNPDLLEVGATADPVRGGRYLTHPEPVDRSHLPFAKQFDPQQLPHLASVIRYLDNNCPQDEQTKAREVLIAHALDISGRAVFRAARTLNLTCAEVAQVRDQIVDPANPKPPLYDRLREALADGLGIPAAKELRLDPENFPSDHHSTFLPISPEGIRAKQEETYRLAQAGLLEATLIKRLGLQIPETGSRMNADRIGTVIEYLAALGFERSHIIGGKKEHFFRRDPDAFLCFVVFRLRFAVGSLMRQKLGCLQPG